MHELSLAMSVVDVITAEAEKINCFNVKSVEIEVGILAGIEIESFEFCIENVKRASRFNDARFIIKRIDATSTCLDCGNTFHSDSIYSNCPKCGSRTTILNSGTELRVSKIIFDT